MADSFTFTDRVQAILASCTCLSCFPSSGSADDPQTHPGTDADALSLHSNYASADGIRHLPRKGPKRISLFGWNLFGHSDNGVRLPDSDDEDENTSLFGRRHKKRAKRSGREPGLESSSTLDSDADAAPLDVSSIDIRAAEEAERRQKEVEKAERRRLRHERKELKRLALAAAFDDAGEFEGFPGSGSSLQPSFSPHLPQFTPSPRPDQRNEEVEPDADLDGGAYFGRTGSRNGDSRSNSDSRSRTSASRSTDGGQYAYRPHPTQLRSSEPLPLASQQPPFSKKKRSKNSAQSSSSASASISLPSPAAPDTHGFQPLIQGLDPTPAHDDEYESKFPSVGLTSAPRLQRAGSLRDQGAKLAQSGF